MLIPIENPRQSLLDQLYAERKARAHQSCHDCGVAPGTAHLDGCDTARCLNTGIQRLQCDCGKCGDDVWTGMWPGIQECYDLKLVCYDESTKDFCFDLNRQYAIRIGMRSK